MSSRKSSKRNNNLDVSVRNTSTSDSRKNIRPLQYRVINFIFTTLYYSSILYYLYNLEDINCNCIRDWRHNFIKGMCLLGIFLGIVNLAGVNTTVHKIIIIILLILGLFNIYAFFTYIGELNYTKCACAVDKQPNLNSIMQFLRWMPIIIFGLAVVSIIILAIFGFALSQYIKK